MLRQPPRNSLHRLKQIWQRMGGEINRLKRGERMEALELHRHNETSSPANTSHPVSGYFESFHMIGCFGRNDLLRCLLTFSPFSHHSQRFYLSRFLRHILNLSGNCAGTKERKIPNRFKWVS